MLKGNLATRPFYNERVVSLAIVIAALVGVGLTAFNATTLYRLSSKRAEQRVELDRFSAEADKSRAAAEAMERSLDRGNLLRLGAATSEANTLIEQRMFSWTAFFGVVERTLPMDARLMAVAPRIERGVFMIVMTVNVKRAGDLETFIDNLYATGTFYDLLPSDQQFNEDGTQTATLSGAYLAPGAIAPGAKKASSRRGGPRP
jgi:hypothetical protein